jgi:hypothetical protein
MEKHSELPWKLNATPLSSNQNFVVLDAGTNGHSKRVCAVYSATDEADAALIVRAVNAHAELVATLTGMRNAMRLAMPHLPADSVAIHCGEWLDEANEVIWKVTDTYPLPEGIARARQA